MSCTAVLKKVYKKNHTQQIRDDRMSRGLKYTQDNKRMGNRREAKLNTLNTG